MKTYAILLTLSTALASNARAQSLPLPTMSGLLRLVQTSPLPTEGYMDHLTVDVKGQRLFVSGENNKSLITVDMRTGKIIHETKGLGGNPRKPFYLADANEIWVDLGDNTVVGISGTTYEVVKTVELTGGRGAAKRTPDNAAYDPARHLYYAAIVTGADSKDGSIEIVDTKNAKLLGNIKMNGNDPGGLSIEPTGKRLFVAMGDVVDGDSHVKVIGLEKRAVVAEWPITSGTAPHASGLDAAHHRLLVGSRVKGEMKDPTTKEVFNRGHQYEPGRLVVM